MLVAGRSPSEPPRGLLAFTRLKLKGIRFVQRPSSSSLPATAKRVHVFTFAALTRCTAIEAADDDDDDKEMLNNYVH